MCLIVDANVAHVVLGRPAHEDSLPITRWLARGGRVVFGGENFRELLKCGGAVIARLVELERAGRARNVDKTQPGEVEAETREVSSSCLSDDPHVVALARVSGARVLASRDAALHADFKNKALIDHPRGSIYQDASHAHLLLPCP